MFQALCKRRNVRLRYDRYAHGITASVVANVNRTKAEDPVIQPFDFVRDEESSRKKEKLDRAKAHCKKVMNVPNGTSIEKIQEIRLKAIKDLEASGYQNAEQIMNDCWPSLKPKDK